ncbi:MAG: hypothetical protein JJE09_03190 [Bacteroidia bacterium]|nr:hypothetical protein [Bacteroidia bacterium]
MDLLKLLNILYRYIWLLVLAAFVASIITFYQLNSQPASYRATTNLLVGPSLDSPSPDLNSLKIGGQLTQTYAEMVNTSLFLDSVYNKLDQESYPGEHKSVIQTRQSATTRVLTIIVFNRDPNIAIAVANAVAQTLLEISPSTDNTTTLLRDQLSDQVGYLEQIVSQSEANIKKLEAELTTLKNAKTSSPEAAKANQDKQSLVVKQLADERSRFFDALKTLASFYQVLLGTNTNQIMIIQPAIEATIVDQQLLLKVISSGVSGMIFAIIIIFVAEYSDDRIRYSGDLSRVANVPLLSTIDKHERLNGSGLEKLVTFAQPESPVANSYREVVVKLQFSTGKSTPYTLLLSSVGSQAEDDAAVTAGNLAVAFAQAGYKVVLVDAQVENPVLTTIFNAEKKEGLADLVLTKSTKLELLPVEQVPGIRFLPAGLSSEKSSREMLNSTKMGELFKNLQKEADIVLVAGSAISRFAESLTLASQVKAIILVARHTDARSKVVNKVIEDLRLMKINLAGVIYDYNPSPFISKLDKKNNLSEHTTKS